jgi:hypothetical protein
MSSPSRTQVAALVARVNSLGQARRIAASEFPERVRRIDQEMAAAQRELQLAVAR